MNAPTRADDERLLDWLALREAGWTYERIAQRAGVSTNTVTGALRRVSEAERKAGLSHEPGRAGTQKLGSIHPPGRRGVLPGEAPASSLSPGAAASGALWGC